jgi:FtsH-binding integral membrane protein
MNTPTKSLLSVFGSLLVFVIVAFSIAINSFKDGKFTCNKYTLNTYLYIILTFNIIAIFCLILEHNNIQYKINLWQLVTIFLVTIALLISLHFITADNIVLKHFIWALFVLGIGFIFYPMYNSFADKSVVLSAAFTTILLTIGLSIIAYVKPEWINLSIGPILFILLVGGIIMELSLLVIYRKNYSKISNIFRATSYFFIAVFMGYILYDTKMLQIRAKKCVKADYIQESLHLFLDIMNIFVRMLALR